MSRLSTCVAAWAAAAAALAAFPAAAQFRNAEAAIKYRQSVMVIQNFHLGRIFGMVSGRVPFDAKVVADDAALIDTVDKLEWIAFGEGTDKGAPTKAKPEIWKERAKFDAAATKMQDEVAKLAAVAKGGNPDQIKAAVGAVGQSCKACHDSYRSE